MLVKLKLDPKLLWKLSDEAEKKKITFHDYLVKKLASEPVEALAVVPFVDPIDPPRERSRYATAEATRTTIGELVALGFTDTEIAIQVERVVQHVARVRRGLGLKANVKRKRK